MKLKEIRAKRVSIPNPLSSGFQSLTRRVRLTDPFQADNPRVGNSKYEYRMKIGKDRNGPKREEPKSKGGQKREEGKAKRWKRKIAVSNNCMSL